MNGPLNIVIVGGGTAGWMCAAALTGLLPPFMRRVRLVESESIGTVGVGEASLPQLKDFNDRLGIDEATFMAASNATFKVAIEFVDWGAEGGAYMHPFAHHGREIGGVEFAQQWARARRAGFGRDYDFYCLPIVAARGGRFGFPGKFSSHPGASFGYAYHIDAAAYARFLRTYAETRGAERLEGEVVSVERNESSGNIEAVRLKSGERLEGDLFIDCTGFRGLLIGEHLKSPWEDWTRWLPCDRAAAVQSERGGGPLLPYTRSTARPAGWRWRIPLQHRTGNGYVFCSRHISEDEAVADLLSGLDGPALTDPRILKFSAGRRLETWRANCVAVGLSGGFLEPLESTSIYLIQKAVELLVDLAPLGADASAQRAEFNRLIDYEYDRVRDFLILHYHLNARSGDFWRECREMSIPESLERALRVFVHRGSVEQREFGLFAPASWYAVLFGQGAMPAASARFAERVPLDRLRQDLEDLETETADWAAGLPRHERTVETYCASGALNVLPT